jgi:signal transduction histidine kinase
LIFFEDVTDHIALERSYNTLFAVQKATLNNLHEAAAVFGSDGQLKLYNASFCKIWNLSDEFLTGNPHVSEILERCGAYFIDNPDGEVFGIGMVSDDSNRIIRASRLQRADNSVIDYTSVPLPDGATLLTYLDVTDSIRIERALRERNEALEATDRLKTEFIAHVSYSLRTPLNSVIGFAELLEHEYYGPLNSQQHGYTRHILESSSQLMVLINGIIDLSVISAGRMQLEMSDIDLSDILTSVAEHIREEANSRNLRVDLMLPRRMEIIRGDEQRIKQVLYNLTGNAFKFTSAGGKITLGATCGNGNVELYVADNGIGIAAEEQEKVFETFQTGKEARQGQGAGLGLSLVRRFVELHGGRVELASEPGKGTKVTCIFPIKEDVGMMAAEVASPTQASVY